MATPTFPLSYHPHLQRLRLILLLIPVRVLEVQVAQAIPLQ